MKIALGQINPTVGDVAGNLALIKDVLTRAEAAQVDLLLLPELAMCAYPPRDLLERPALHEQIANGLQNLCARVGTGAYPTAVLVGHPEPHNNGGHGLYNSVSLIDGDDAGLPGRIFATVQKTLLPTYDVFDEARYFDPGPGTKLVTWRGKNLGITICEDGWSDDEFWPVPKRHGMDPVATAAQAGADILINVAASPFSGPKRQVRTRMLAHAARRWRRPLYFVNQVGAHDDLIFDGASAAFDCTGAIIARAKEFAEDFVVVDGQTPTPHLPAPLHDEDALLQALVLGVRDYVRRCGFSKVLLGLSGGIDSALVAWIAAEALGPDKVHAVALPSRYSSQDSHDDAHALADNLGVTMDVIAIEGPYCALLQALQEPFAGTSPDVTEENLQARIRGVLLMALSNKFGSLLLTTGNKSEIATGYCTLYGDMCGALAVIADLWKTEVFSLCRRINHNAGKEVIPETIITKPPSAELRPDQKDEDSLPPYGVLDAMLKGHVERKQDSAALIAAGFEPGTVNDVLRLVRITEHKRNQMAPGLKVSDKAFGSGRRHPIAQRFVG